MASIGWYIIAAIVFLVIPSLGSSRDKKLFWRLSTLVLLAASEASILTSSSTILSLRLPLGGLFLRPLLAHEAVTLLHQTWILFNIALSQLPILSAVDDTDATPDRLALQAAPLAQSMVVRTDLTISAVDQLLRKQVKGRTSSSADERELLDKLVETMARL